MQIYEPKHALNVQKGIVSVDNSRSSRSSESSQDRLRNRRVDSIEGSLYVSTDNTTPLVLDSTTEQSIQRRKIRFKKIPIFLAGFTAVLSSIALLLLWPRQPTVCMLVRASSFQYSLSSISLPIETIMTAHNKRWTGSTSIDQYTVEVVTSAQQYSVT